MNKQLPTIKKAFYCHIEECERNYPLFNFWVYQKTDSRKRIALFVTNEIMNLIDEDLYAFTPSAVCNECLAKGINLSNCYDSDEYRLPMGI